MVIYDMFCKIDEPICVSQKLGLYLINTSKRDPFYSEVKRILNKDLSNQKKHSKKWDKKHYDLREILMSSYWKGLFNVNIDSSEKDCIDSIIKNIVILTQLDIPRYNF